ncbi:MAG: glutamate/gamma-aminobutyrate family transporter YjeM [Sarcina sp.]
MSNNKKKLTLIPLVLLIFSAVFGFTNMPRAFYLMGYAAIPWYIFGAITFMIPYASMIAEYGAAFKDEKGGIYSWMAKTVGPRYAFVGTFMWFFSYVIWLVSTSSSIWIPFSTAITGSDSTANWGVMGLSSTQVIGILGVLWIIFITVASSRGMDKIKKITSIGGTAITLLNVVLILGAVVVLILNKGALAQPITSIHSFTTSPNSAYLSPIAMMSFAVFAIFAFGGLEVVGGLVDQTENPVKTFPKGIILSAIIIAVAYCIGIFMCGVFTNWNSVLSGSHINMANVAYVLMNNLGVALGQGFGLSMATSLTIGSWIARFVGLSMFLALTGAFFTLAYSPVKQLIEGTPKEIWPKKLTKLNDKGMPFNAMIVQCIIVVCIILFTSFAGQDASEFFSKLVLMTNVAMTVPCIFVAGAFYKFKKNEKIVKPFAIFKTKTSALIASVVVIIVVGFGNAMTIIEPAMQGKIGDTITMIAGPVIFAIVALFLYWFAEYRCKKEGKVMGEEDNLVEK